MNAKGTKLFIFIEKYLKLFNNNKLKRRIKLNQKKRFLMYGILFFIYFD